MSSDRIITPTGRLVFEDKLKPSAEEFRRQAEQFREKMQEAMDRFKSHEDGEGRRYFVLTGDYSQLELYALAAMMHESKNGVVLDFEGSGSMPGIADPLMMLRQSGGQIAEVVAKKPAVKQNGRSAAYLAHDPTKKARPSPWLSRSPTIATACYAHSRCRPKRSIQGRAAGCFRRAMSRSCGSHRPTRSTRAL